LTVLNRLGDIFDYAHRNGVKVVIYPLDNPSGYDRGLRYNADSHRGSGGNNDCLRYELADGTITGDIGDGSDPLTGKKLEVRGIHWSDDPAMKIDLPRETRASLADLRTLPLSRVFAALDLHGDNYLLRPMTYHYVYGPAEDLIGITSRIARACEILSSCNVEEHPARIPDYEQEVFNVLDDPGRPLREYADEHGCIRHFDGTFPELFSRLGARHCVTVEMSSATPQATSDEVQMAWVEGLVDLARDRQQGKEGARTQ
jgi:hypothetical protein